MVPLQIWRRLVESGSFPNFSAKPVAAVDLLLHLMAAHGRKQGDLPEVGSQGVVSEVLRGHRELNLRQVRALAKRFSVPAAVFLTQVESES